MMLNGKFGFAVARKDSGYFSVENIYSTATEARGEIARELAEDKANGYTHTPKRKVQKVLVMPCDITDI